MKLKWSFACRYCGKIFEIHPSEAKRRPEAADFCQISCRLQFSEREVKRRRSEGLPLIDVTYDSVRCLICGRTYSAIGCHMDTHGVHLRGLNHYERNLALGLGCGERAVPEIHLARMRETGSLDYFGSRRNPGGKIMGDEQAAYQARLRAAFPCTDYQLAVLKQNARKMHEKACRRKRILERRGCAKCNKCGATKPLSQFSQSNIGAMGYSHQCKKCQYENS